MAWIPVTITAGGKTYGIHDRLDLSDNEYVMNGDNFIAFAIRRTDGRVSHYLRNPRRQHVNALRKAFGEFISQIPHPIRSGIESIALSTAGGRLAGPAGRIAGVVASRVLSFDSIWQVLGAHEDKEAGYYEVESGQRSTTFQDLLTIHDLALV
ncbi:MAG: hypothetical protein IT431_15570 [Phycisphaerales bacterium]|nr:hypothetical protein [Phycisphaerales bacterium]